MLHLVIKSVMRLNKNIKCNKEDVTMKIEKCNKEHLSEAAKHIPRLIMTPSPPVLPRFLKFSNISSSWVKI